MRRDSLEVFLKGQTEAALRPLGLGPGASVLDNDRGHGQLAETLAYAGCDAIAMGGGLSCGRRIAGLVQTGPHRSMVGDLQRLTFASRSFYEGTVIRLICSIED